LSAWQGEPLFEPKLIVIINNQTGLSAEPAIVKILSEPDSIVATPDSRDQNVLRRRGSERQCQSVERSNRDNRNSAIRKHLRRTCANLLRRI
jgi:hypothetical protein